MITSVKEFGSYKLTRATDTLKSLYDNDNVNNNNESEYVSTCSIKNNWIELELLNITVYNDDTSIFRFQLPNNEKNLNLPVGGFLLVLANDCEHDGGDAIRPYTSISPELGLGYFEIIVKRYQQWGVKENPQTHFLFTKTDHSYRPPGAVSNYIHNLKIGEKLKFKHTAACRVGIGIAPMINILRNIFDDNSINNNIKSITLLYGAREVKDILLKEQLEEWRIKYADKGFKIVYCIGSRWNQVLMGAKTKNEFIPPPLPKGFAELQQAGLPVELGWVNEDKIRRHTPPVSMDNRVLVCGLPGVYDKLCGPRISEEIEKNSVLAILGYSKENVIKL